LPNARKPEKYMAEIDSLKSELQKYIQFFDLKLSKEHKAKISFTNASEFIEASNKAKAVRLQEEKKLNKLGQKANEKYIAEWRNGNDENISKILTAKETTAYYFYLKTSSERIDTRLRISGDNIQTSKGINIPKDVAKRYYDFYNRIVKSGGCNGNCNYKMMDYEVKAATEERLIVGCHDIPVSEINYIANQLNWTASH
jgi:hypothetical protein